MPSFPGHPERPVPLGPWTLVPWWGATDSGWCWIREVRDAWCWDCCGKRDYIGGGVDVDTDRPVPAIDDWPPSTPTLEEPAP